ncbi:restriction endonuclease subunit S [Companilactobacillus sp.]|jgi:type I restriction enzyme S subunit|uniref:restriction endonuclease subunit S n=1 Tax=Companilactobacillus sp. TaxID=2767905 RepID=UPI0025C1B636|nr:restriction endonuclease subunit S [Companilactobacillus sp.]MCH4010029.1 restriction endonuclease subunit S [Companilactobacillus sp.]MCH4052295.1 restriction endonuclease subunit S [Companilactobacillus sp.]MCH4077971.1 restriction endonuclease subunit S [Companilactobacillus sp.]MCH4126547.1 restriction endonuclease subunit S [Companilactobacillus sp.]MCH4132133.1 restriction endonuclease subunit S [Companilactobacillus sp.]
MDKRVPKVRFKGFTDDWEQRSFDSLVRRKSATSNDKNLFKIEYEDIVPGLGIMNGAPKLNITERKGILFQQNDILFGKLRPYLKNWLIPSFRGVAIGDFWVLKPVKTNYLFDYYLIQSERFQSNANLSTGTKMPRSDWKLVSKSQYRIPTNADEQKNIGNLINKLENSITLYQRKLELYTNLKKALLQRVFTVDSEKSPKIRFTGFNDDWEQVKFGDIYKKVNEKNNMDFSENDIISVANMYFKNENKKPTADYMRTYNVFRIKDIAFEGNKSKYYSHGRFKENIIGDGIVSHVFDVYRPLNPDNHDINFWNYRISDERIMGPVLSRVTTKSTMMTNLVAKDFLKFPTLLPSFSEQRRIGLVLLEMDDLVQKYQKQLQQITQVKSFLLRSMFV